MDEKESVLVNSVETLESDPKAGSEPPNQPVDPEVDADRKSDIENSENTNDNSDTINSEVSKQSSDVGLVEISETSTSLQNHVEDAKKVDGDSQNEDTRLHNDVEDVINKSTDKDEETENSQDSGPKVDEAQVDETQVEETQVDETQVDKTQIDENQVDETQVDETKEEEAKVSESIDEMKDDSQDSTTVPDLIEGDSKLNESASQKDDDDIENPQFENASATVDESQEDHTEALDPFDALLKDRNDTVNTVLDVEANTNVNDDDDHNVDDTSHDIDHIDADETNLEENNVPEIVEEPGADEEVCLLPDTEREISEADKAEAEKVLAEKRKKAEEEALASESLVAKEETETLDTEDTPEVANEVSHNESQTVDETAPDGVSQENGADRDVENDESAEILEPSVPDTIQEISPVDELCVQCSKTTSCTYRFMKNSENNYICTEACVKAFQSDHLRQYTVINKKYLIEEITPNTMTCSECEETVMCYFYYNYDGEDTNYCSLKCLYSMMADEKDKYKFKRRRLPLEELDPPIQETCDQCGSYQSCQFTFNRYGLTHYLCSMPCIKALNQTENRFWVKKKKTQRKPMPTTPTTTPAQPKPVLLKLKVISNATDKYLDDGKIQAKTPAMIQAAREDRERSFVRKCTQCNLVLTLDEKNLTWETLDFCNEICLGRYQNRIGSQCANCSNSVNHTSLGKYCVRFGYDIRQFCNSSCLEEFKKGLKICCYCQRDISAGHQGFLAPVGDKGQFKDFCSQGCMEKFDQMSKNPVPQPVWAKCAVCSIEKLTTIEMEINVNSSQRLCSEPCFAAYKFVNSVCPDQCHWCKKFFERKSSSSFTIYEGAGPQCFCSKSCINVHISNTRHIVPCSWCKVKKYNFDMIKKNTGGGQSVMMCSLNCLNLYQVSVNAVSSRRIKCDLCKRLSQAQYHLTMSDATVRNFCTYQCVMSFQSQYAKPLLGAGEQAAEPKAVPTGAPRRTYSTAVHKNNAKKQLSGLPVISNVQSLATPPPLITAPGVHTTRGKSKRHTQLPPPPEPAPPRAPPTPPPPPKPPTPPPPPPPKIYNHVLVKTLPPVQVSNKATLTKPMMVSKGVSCRPHPCTKECQTDPSLERRVLIPVPVPIYVPVPCAMYSLPFPVPVPIPIPIPTPVFIPTTRNSAKGIMKEISKIHDKMPTDPFEAELLMMAEMVAGDKKKDQSDSETDEENTTAPEDGFSPVAMDGNNAFGEDMLQMALKMATEYEEPAVDLESAMTANTITPSSHPSMPGLEGEGMHHHHMMVLEQQRAVAALRATAAPRKRAPPAPAPAVVATAPRTRGKRRRQEPAPAPQPEPPREPAEKPDANMCLKYTFGVNAWKQWVMTKNAEIEKSSVRRKPFKSEILQLTADELNYSLCLFVKEVRKPNGSEYAPDTIYYLVLGIQQYLFENGRIDNIFTDPYYEKFTDCLDEVARKFSVLYNDSQYIVTRVEEEHLWESKQLGAHSPHVLLSTLMFFNTKHFNLVTVDEHMQLSFSHIMKHWKRNPNQPGQAKLPGSRNVLLRFYPPQSALEANSRKKKVYEQQENEENPLRCPVKLYEFYISKCPESVRTRNDVFYLQPERSCVPDSPVWYSTQPLSRDALAKMLHRVKMVKEINIALLTS